MVSDPITVPTAYSEQELALLRDVAEGGHPRCRPTIDLLYTTGARLGELVGVLLEDVSETHIQLRETKRHPGGLRVERAVPLNPTSRAACEELRAMPGSRSHTSSAPRSTTFRTGWWDYNGERASAAMRTSSARRSARTCCSVECRCTRSSGSWATPVFKRRCGTRL